MVIKSMKVSVKDFDELSLFRNFLVDNALKSLDMNSLNLVNIKKQVGFPSKKGIQYVGRPFFQFYSNT